MLKIYHCTERTLNQHHLLTTVCQNSGEGKPEQLILVPEQISHMLERKLCEYGGDSISAYAEILGFSRLAVRVFSELGGIAGSETDGAGKLMTMSLTVENLHSALKLYGSKALKPHFLLQLSQTLDELRSSCITADILRKKLTSLEGAFAVKMEELALLLEGYDSVCSNLGQNADSRLTRLLLALEQNDYAKGKVFYFYGFTDFNGVEMEIIRQILADEAEVVVYLLCDSLRSEELQFLTASTTGRELVRIAQKTQTPCEIHSPDPVSEGYGLSFLRENLFGSKQVEVPKTELVRFLTATDVATECRMVVGEILKLIEQGVRLRDITVACADYTSYRSPLRTVFRRAEIPAYFAGDTDILKQPVVHMLLSALEASMEYDREAVISYMKTGFADLTFDEADKLENYVHIWDIDGKRFDENWTMSPRGLIEEKEYLKKKHLAELNGARVKLMKPLLTLHNGIFAAKTTGQMLLALNRFMEDISLNQKLNEQAILLSENNEKQKSQEYAQVYGIICRLMEQMYGVLGETVRSPEDFLLLFRTAVSLYTVGTIPATIDCVNIGSLSSQRNCETPYLFVVGANEGVFPAVQGNQSLLSDRERQKLIDLEIGISPNTLATGKLNRELAMIDSVLGGPVKVLYFSALQGKESHYYLRSKNLYPNSHIVTDDSALILRSPRDYEARYEAVEPYEKTRLSHEAVRALYGDTIQLSATKLESVSACRFEYFLKYGLRAKEMKTAELDSSAYGTFVHYVLEWTSRTVMDEGGFRKVSLDRVMEIADFYMEKYAKETLTDLWHSERAEYLFRRNFHEIRSVVQNIYEELSQSEFEPEIHELQFNRNEDGDSDPVPIVGETVKGLLEGKVDRFDIYRKGDRTYYRIIDYKTGHTTFDYTSVYYGLGLQMLIYLFALKEYGNKLEYENLTPAGVLYVPATTKKVSISDPYDEGNLNADRIKGQRRSGLLLDDPAILRAMEPGEGFRFLPCSVAKKTGEIKGYLASGEDLRILRDHVFRKMSQLTDSIYSGNLEPDPYYADKEHYRCKWCPYKTICGEDVEKRIFEKLKEEDFWTKLREEYSHG